MKLLKAFDTPDQCSVGLVILVNPEGAVRNVVLCIGTDSEVHPRHWVSFKSMRINPMLEYEGLQAMDAYREEKYEHAQT